MSVYYRSNNLQTFMESIDSAKPYVTCPACGNNIALRDISSYRMVLTDNARDELNRAIQAVRNILAQTEVELARINRFGIKRPKIDAYPHGYEINAVFPNLGANGLYSNSVEMNGVKALIRRLDVFEFIKHFHEQKWPGHSKSTQAEQTSSLLEDEELLDENNEAFNAGELSEATSKKGSSSASFKNPVVDILLAGLDKASIAGPLVDLIFDQDDIIAWLPRATNDSGDGLRDALAGLLYKICPNFATYLQDELQKINKDSTSIDLRQQILRAQLVLIIFLGHTSPTATTHSEHLFEDNSAFELPGTTHIRDHFHLQQLLSSHLVLQFCNLGWDPQIIAALKVELNSTNANQVTPKEIEDLVGSELHRLIRFTCAGPAGEVFDQRPLDVVEQQQEDRGNAETAAFSPQEQNEMLGTNNPDANEWSNEPDEESDDTRPRQQKYCGWYPKHDHTYPVVLLGSPGCGKSTVMLTGLLAFIESLSVLHASYILDRPQDVRLNEDKSREYWSGQLPKPTAKGTRQSIHLRIAQTTGTKSSGNFVFTDIPGETLISAVTDKGASSALLGILSAAETIVLFFDMVIEDSIRRALASQKNEIAETGPQRLNSANNAPANVWERLNTAYAKIKVEREKNQAEVQFSQFNLLNRVIENLKMKRPDDIQPDGKIHGVNFICVLPKIDLFADMTSQEQQNPRLFFTSFFDDMKRKNVLYDSPYREGSLYEGLVSAAGIGSKYFYNPNSDEAKVEDNPQTSENVGQEPSDHEMLGGLPDAEDANRDSRYQPSTKVEVSLTEIAKEISKATIECLDKIGNGFYHHNPRVYPEAIKLRNKIQESLVQKLYDTFYEENVYFLPVCAQGEADKKQAESNSEYLQVLGGPPNQKLAEFVFMLPVALSIKPAKDEPISKEVEHPTAAGIS